MSFQTVEDLFNSTKVPVTTDDLDEGLYLANLKKVNFQNTIPMTTTFIFDITNDSENGDFAGQTATLTFRWHNKQGELLDFVAVRFKKFASKLLGAEYSHEYQETKEALEAIDNMPVTLRVTKGSYKNKQGAIVETTNVTALQE